MHGASTLVTLQSSSALLRIQRDRRICAPDHGLPISPLRIMECQLIDSTIRSCGAQQRCLW
ncbi:hypothetical protein INR49_009025 [Caranx melampygus]|nr:hypothetical protein INR49_009025 [Caranx melampygus]